MRACVLTHARPGCHMYNTWKASSACWALLVLAPAGADPWRERLTRHVWGAAPALPVPLHVVPASGLPPSLPVGRVTALDVDVPPQSVPPGFARESLVITAWMVKFFLHQDSSQPDFTERYGTDDDNGRLLLRPCNTQVRWCDCQTAIMVLLKPPLFVFLVDAAEMPPGEERPLCAFGLSTSGSIGADDAALASRQGLMHALHDNANLCNTSWKHKLQVQPLWVYENHGWNVIPPAV